MNASGATAGAEMGELGEMGVLAAANMEALMSFSPVPENKL